MDTTMHNSFVFLLSDGWHAVFCGKLAMAMFNCKGAAEAWVDSCVALGRWRA